MHLLTTFPNQFQKQHKFVRGEGPYLWNESGTKFLDLTCGGTSYSVLGWGISSIEDAVIQQIKQLPHSDYKSCKSDIREELAHLLATNNHSGLNKVFLSGGSGSEACEMCLHMSYQVHCLEGNPSKSISISRYQSYHGATMGSMTLGERPNLEFYRPLQPTNNHSFIQEHNKYRHRLENESDEEYAIRSANLLESRVLELGPENVGCFVGETMLGGLVGDVPPVKGYWKRIKEICNKYNIHLILDEVWCGTGISGKYFCCDWDDVKPEFVFIGKTLAAGYIPASAVMTNGRIAESLSSGRGRIETSCTFQGHLVATAAALAAQKLILSKGFIENVNTLGIKIRQSLYSELKDHPFFKNVRGRGLRNSIEYECENQSGFGNYLSSEMKERENILISAKWHRISLLPPMTIKSSDLVFGIEKFINTFKYCSKEWNSIKAKEYNSTEYF
tara:strand:- start:1432 stop:2769 length:1338 start_codon:yes stop_codon:yes gene_type:complete